jgi:transposase-like protein
MRESIRRKRDQEARAVLVQMLCDEGDQTFVPVLRRFVRDSDLSISRTAELIGVSPESLKRWIAGITKPHPAKQVRIKCLLKWYAWRDEISKRELVGGLDRSGPARGA